MALQVNQTQIQTIARLYAIGERNQLEPQYNSDVTRTLRQVGDGLVPSCAANVLITSWKCVFDKLNCVL